MSRLDYFFISQDLINRVNNTEIRPKYKSDHARITLNLNLAEHTRGRGFWKFNNLHLHDKAFVEMINQEILAFKFEVKDKFTTIRLDLQWEELKQRLIKISKNYAGKKQKRKTYC